MPVHQVKAEAHGAEAMIQKGRLVGILYLEIQSREITFQMCVCVKAMFRETLAS